jgi:WD40 repeat protein/predicted Ser/Thr protein kinase
MLENEGAEGHEVFVQGAAMRGRDAVLLILRAAVSGHILSQAAADEFVARLAQLPEEQATPAWLVAQGILTAQQVAALVAGLPTQDAGYPPISSATPSAEPPPAKPALPRIRGYEIIEVLGSGGMGVVYRANQLQPRRPVAVKVMNVHLQMTEAHRLRFEREAQAAADLAHPNVVTIYEYGVVEGVPFFSMELVEGKSLDRFVSEEELAIEERLKLMQTVCGAVSYAHQHGVIHRDLKPANILVTAEGQPKVMDFGLAKVSESPDRGMLETLTLAGEVLGTVPYMAPEQTLGRPEEIDIRTDVYALGVILYQVVTGRLPQEPRGEHVLELMRRIREEAPDPPSSVNRVVDEDLQTIILKALSKEKERRYQTAAALAADLGHYLADEPIEAKPPSAAYYVRKLVRRYRVALIPIGVAFAIIILVIATSFVRIRRERDLANRNAAEARAEKKRADEQRDLAIENAAEAQRQKNAALQALSKSDFLEACHLAGEDSRGDAVAYLVRSLSSNPKNGAALTRLTTLLAYQSWMVSSLVLRHKDSVNSAEFSGDGTRIVTASSDSTAQVWDAQSGHPIGEPLKHAGAVRKALFSPDGTQIVTASWDCTARIWDAQTGRPVVGPFKHDLWVNFAQFSPDGKRIVTASYDHTARVWDLQAASPLRQTLKHNDTVWSAQFSPDGKQVVTASFDNTARVWDAQSGQPVTNPMKHDSAVYWAPFSADGTRIVTASLDNSARVWDAQSGRPVTDPMKHDSGVYSASFSADGSRIVTASYDNTARVWDARSGRAVTGPLRHGDTVVFAAFSPDGKRIVTASWDCTARVWDARSGDPLTEALKHGNAVHAALFSPDGKRILTASADSTARVWDAFGGRALAGRLQHSDKVLSAVFSPDGTRILTGCEDGARVWDAQSGRMMIGPLKHSGKLTSAVFSPRDGTRILTASEDHSAQVWDALTGKPVGPPLMHDGPLKSAQFSPDGKRVVTVSGLFARVWDAQSGQPLTGPLKHDGAVVSAAFSPDGGKIITSSWDKTARLWDVKNGQALGKPLRHDGAVVSAAFSPDGKRIVTASYDKTARVWDAQSGEPLTTSLQHGDEVRSAIFSPDGNRVLTAAGNSAHVWDAHSCRPVTEPLKHDFVVYSAAFSPDGKLIVTASWDNSVRVWDAQTGQPLTESLEQDDTVVSASFSPDGRRIVTASDDKTARVWDIAPSCAEFPKWLLDVAGAVSGQALTKQGVLERIPEAATKTLDKIRQDLKTMPDNDDWVIWGRWFLADPATRTISPFSKITIPEYIEDRIKEHTAEPLDGAEQAAFELVVHGKYPQAEELYRQALAAQERILGKDHPDTLKTMDDLAALLDASGKKDEAAHLRKEREEILQQGQKPATGTTSSP